VSYRRTAPCRYRRITPLLRRRILRCRRRRARSAAPAPLKLLLRALFSASPSPCMRVSIGASSSRGKWTLQRGAISAHGSITMAIVRSSQLQHRGGGGGLSFLCLSPAARGAHHVEGALQHRPRGARRQPYSGSRTRRPWLNQRDDVLCVSRRPSSLLLLALALLAPPGAQGQGAATITATTVNPPLSLAEFKTKYATDHKYEPVRAAAAAGSAHSALCHAGWQPAAWKILPLPAASCSRRATDSHCHPRVLVSLLSRRMRPGTFPPPSLIPQADPVRTPPLNHVHTVPPPTRSGSTRTALPYCDN
jgi:hypothetical protein